VPQVTLQESIMGLREGLTEMGFADNDFRNSKHIRLKVLEAHIASGRLFSNLRWQCAAA
jgi:UDP-glucose 4-epimerase